MSSPAHAPASLDALGAWFDRLFQTGALIELAALAGCAVLAWALVTVAQRATGFGGEKSILFGQRRVDGAMFPLLLLAFAALARALLVRQFDLAVLTVALPVLVALACIRVGAKVLHAAFTESPLISLLERTISWLAWVAMVLWLSGLLPVLLEELDQIRWKVGSSTLSMRNLIEGTVTAGAVLIVTLWISSAIESRLLQATRGGDLSLRKMASNATRALLLFVGLILALSAVGIDLTALSVLGGAAGVGIGLGLQRLAANYVSGFVILAERSTRIGDTVRVDNFEGKVSDINARYTVLRAPNGREAYVPNEMLISSRLENLSRARLQSTTQVLVGHRVDVTLVTGLLTEATAASPRILREPEPLVALSALTPDGLEFTISYWIGDPENGELSVRSALNTEILRSLRAHGIELAGPQRFVRLDTALEGGELGAQIGAQIGTQLKREPSL